MNAPASIKTVREQIADRLRNEILSFQLAPAERLRETDLAARFGTSRGPVRDVLLQLTQEGALHYKPNSGVRVSDVPDDATRKFLMSLRRQIEGRAVKNFIANQTDEDAETLNSILKRMRRACEEGDMAEIAGADLALHDHIVKRGAAPDIEAVWQTVAVRIRMAYSRLTDHQEIYNEHAAIVEAILAGDLETALTRLESNLQ